MGHMYNVGWVPALHGARDLIKKRQLGRAVRSKEARAKIASEMQEQEAGEKKKKDNVSLSPPTPLPQGDKLTLKNLNLSPPQLLGFRNRL